MAAVHFRAMNIYRFFTVNEFDAVVSELSKQCAHDADARAVGESLVTETHGVEVWDAGRRVAKLKNGRLRISD